MNPQIIIQKYYREGSRLYDIFMSHAESVAGRSVELTKKHPELEMDVDFVYEAAMLHDIGIFLTDAPKIDCFGIHPYICHGYLGAELLQQEGYPEHALVCERHTGTGISLNQIITNDLPLPHQDMQPQTLEEQLICFVDIFYSKTKLGKIKEITNIREKMLTTGRGSVTKFDNWCNLFL